MKTLTRITLLAVGLAAAALPIAAAGTPVAAAKHPRFHALLAHRMAVRQLIAKKLGLSAGQISQLRADRVQTAATVKAIRADTNLAPEQKKTQVRDALKATRNEMLSGLTPDQQAKLREMRARFRARD